MSARTTPCAARLVLRLPNAKQPRARRHPEDESDPAASPFSVLTQLGGTNRQGLVRPYQ
jgi:hypothetical protein